MGDIQNDPAKQMVPKQSLIKIKSFITTKLVIHRKKMFLL